MALQPEHRFIVAEPTTLVIRILEQVRRHADADAWTIVSLHEDHAHVLPLHLLELRLALRGISPFAPVEDAWPDVEGAPGTICSTTTSKNRKELDAIADKAPSKLVVLIDGASVVGIHRVGPAPPKTRNVISLIPPAAGDGGKRPILDMLRDRHNFWYKAYDFRDAGDGSLPDPPTRPLGKSSPSSAAPPPGKDRKRASPKQSKPKKAPKKKGRLIKKMKGPAPFEAYPRLDAPLVVEPEVQFAITVGFRADLDPTLIEASPISIPAPTPGERIHVFITGNNVELIGSTTAQLPLEPGAKADFLARTTPGAMDARINVSYVYMGNVVGFAARHVGTNATHRESGRPGAPLVWLSKEDAPDATIQITRKNERELEWYMFTKERFIGPKASNPNDAKRFARRVVKQLEGAADSTILAKNALDTAAGDVAREFPKEIRDEIVSLARHLKRPPLLLLLTEEFYIPWELARLDNAPDDKAYPIVGAQASVGRWLLQSGVQTIPSTLVRVKSISAIASEYGAGSGQGALKHALEEQAHLSATYKAQKVEALTIPVCDLIADPHWGRIFHFAVHGASVADDTSEATLILADRYRLTADQLAGSDARGPEEPPCAEFVFMNACQVGTANDDLGQATGFPGRLLASKVTGFVAPLWKVNDEEARKIATRFYEEAFKGGYVGDIMRRTRAPYDKAASLTLLAYTYYGHPKLLLKHQT